MCFKLCKQSKKIHVADILDIIAYKIYLVITFRSKFKKVTNGILKNPFVLLML